MITLVEIRRDRLDRRHLLLPVTRDGAAPNPSWGVDFAFVDRDAARPDAADWTPGEWAGADARILVGPDGAVTPEPGVHVVWLRVDAPPELVVEPVGLLHIT